MNAGLQRAQLPLRNGNTPSDSLALSVWCQQEAGMPRDFRPNIYHTIKAQDFWAFMMKGRTRLFNGWSPTNQIGIYMFVLYYLNRLCFPGSLGSSLIIGGNMLTVKETMKVMHCGPSTWLWIISWSNHWRFGQRGHFQTRTGSPGCERNPRLSSSRSVVCGCDLRYCLDKLTRNV